MDTTLNLEGQLIIAKRMVKAHKKKSKIDQGDALQLAELVIALNEGILNGSLLPDSWIAAQDQEFDDD